MRKTGLLFISVAIAATAVGEQSSLVWMKTQEIVENRSIVVRRSLGDFTVAELPESTLVRMRQAGIAYETIDERIEEARKYWLVWDPSSQGFGQLHDLVDVLGIFGDVAVLTGDPATVEEKVPSLGFELENPDVLAESC